MRPIIGGINAAKIKTVVMIISSFLKFKVECSNDLCSITGKLCPYFIILIPLIESTDSNT
jgi:hypothetical protein